MKKIIVLLFSLLFITMCTVTCFADAPYSSAHELFSEYFSGYDNLPDYICGIWSTDGGEKNLTFAIQDTDEGNAGKLEILELVEDDSTVSFVYQKYSYNYLCRVQEELLPYLQMNIGIVASGVYPYENCVKLTVREKDRNSDAIVTALAEIKATYGDVVLIEYLDGEIVFTDRDSGLRVPFSPDLPKHSTSPFFFAGIAILALFSVTAFFFVFRKKALLQTNSGKTVSTEPVTNKEIEAMVKSSNAQFPADLDEKIMNDIEKK